MWKGIRVRHLMFCAILIASVGAITAAQDRGSENTKELGSESTPLSSIGSKWRWRSQPKALDRCLTPFTFLEFCPTLTLLTPHNAVNNAGKKLADDQSFHWLTAIKQSLAFLGVQHGYALTQPKTRRDLKGPFFRTMLAQSSRYTVGKTADGSLPTMSRIRCKALFSDSFKFRTTRKG